MTRYAYNLRSSVAAEAPESRRDEPRPRRDELDPGHDEPRLGHHEPDPGYGEPDARLAPGPVDDAAALAEDPYYYGWRDVYETLPDGSQAWRQVPLTYADLLDPQEEGDYVAEDTVHSQMTAAVAHLLRRRYDADPSVAVFSNLKILFKVPGLTTGPMPDVCVMVGVEDCDRRRWSFRLGEEPGSVALAIEMVSVRSKAKDYRDILEIYSRMGVAEYLAIEPLGDYVTGPYALRFWRYDRVSGRLQPADAETGGAFWSRTTGLLFGTGEDGWGLEIRELGTGKRLLPPEEEIVEFARRARAAEEERERAMEEASRQTERAEQAEERAAQEAASRRRAEAELERLRAELARSRGG